MHLTRTFCRLTAIALILAACTLGSTAAAAQGSPAPQISTVLVKGGCFVDVKAGFDQAALAAAGVRVWRL